MKKYIANGISRRTSREAMPPPPFSESWARIESACIAVGKPSHVVRPFDGDRQDQMASSSARSDGNVPSTIAARIRFMRSIVHATLCRLTSRDAVGSPTLNR